MKSILLILSLTCFYTFSQKQLINGIVKNDLNNHLEKVSILNKTTGEGSTTDTDGLYTIKASKGDYLVFSHLGYKEFKIRVKNKQQLNITLKTLKKILPEISVKTRKHRTQTTYKMGMARIDINSPDYISADELPVQFYTVRDALKGRVAGINIPPGTNKVFLRDPRYPVLWDVDGVLMEETPPIFVNDVKSIVILRRPSQTIMYGPRGFGGVIVINTFLDEYQREKRDITSLENPYTNKNLYAEDAINFNEEVTFNNSDYLAIYTKNIENNTNLYISKQRKYGNEADFYSTTLSFLKNNNFDQKLILKVLSDFETNFSTNIEHLKTIAFQYDFLNQNELALKVHKKIAMLTPKSIQSCINLAKAYTKTGDLTSAWKVYKYYVNKNLKKENKNLEAIFNSEMIWTYKELKKQKKIKEKIKFDTFNNIEAADIRLVFEWNNDADFAFELVNPNEQVYQHATNLSVTDKKTNTANKENYNSKEFYITDLEEKKWLVNNTFLGNKNNDSNSTFLKATVYYNWGNVDQREEIKIFKMNIENTKYQLFKF